MTFLGLVCFTLFDKKEIVSLSRMFRSEMVELIAVSYLEKMVSSGYHLLLSPARRDGKLVTLFGLISWFEIFV